MTNVSTQAELAAAIAAQETDIVVTASFLITQQHNLNYTVTISSDENGPYTLTKDDTFSDAIFNVSTNGSLTLRNIILDGAKDTHSVGLSLVTAEYGSLILESGAVLQNNRAGTGGGVNVGNSDALACSLIMRGNAVIRDNYAQNNGGGVFASKIFATVDIGEQAVIENNQAQNSGGGIYFDVNESENFTVSGNAKISGNRASSYGGGIDVYSGTVRISDNVQISQNSALNGGGIATLGSGIVIEDGVFVNNNTASSLGGGVYVYSQQINVAIHASLQANTATSGGGAYIDSFVAPALDFSNARFIENSSTERSNGGGGLMITSGEASTYPITMNNAVFDGNKSEYNGGAVCLDLSTASTFELSVDNCTFENNSAYRFGGGIYIHAQQRSTVSIQNSTFNNNEAQNGGGVHALQESTQEALDMVFQNVVFENNLGITAGGIFFGGGEQTVVMSNITMRNNTSRVTGGGIASREGTGSIVIDQSEFHSNKADEGGGIHFLITPIIARTLTLSDVSFSGNTARNGKDILNYGNMMFGSSIIIPDGLYITQVRAIPVIVENLSEDSLVMLERSSVIRPNPEGRPVVVATSALPLSLQDAVAFVAPPEMAGWGARVSDTGNSIVLAPVRFRVEYQNTLGAENPNPTAYEVVTPTIVLQDLQDLPDHRFLGWYTELEGGEQVTEIPLGSVGDKVLYARWHELNHTVTYYGNDAEGPSAENIPLPQSVREGESVVLSDASPTRTGYLFLSWNTAQDGSGTTYRPQDTIVDVTENIALYAQWQFLPPDEHVLAYHPNDDEESPAQGMPENISVTDGDTAHISQIRPTREGYSFINWNTASDGSGVSYLPDDTIADVRSDIDLYAQWLLLPPIMRKLTYHANDIGGTPAKGIPLPETVVDGQSVSIANTAPTREGYAFTGWNTEPNGSGTTYLPGSVFGPITSDSHLYAQWQKLAEQYRYVYFMPNVFCCEVFGMPYPIRCESMGQVVIPCSIPCRKGCCFVGWNTRADGCGMWYMPEDLIYLCGRDEYLFAQWQ